MGQDELVVTQADYDIAKRANVLWGEAINGPHVAVLAAALSRIASERAVLEQAAKVAESEAGQYSEDGEGDAWIALRIAQAIRSLLPVEEEGG